MKIPAVVGARDLTRRVKNGDWMIVDGYEGAVTVNPSEQTLFRYGQIRLQKKTFEQRLMDAVKEPSVTLDGVDVPLRANIEKADETDLVGVHNRVDTVSERELRQDPANVGLDRRLLDRQRVGDLAVGETGRDEGKDLPFARGERVHAVSARSVRQRVRGHALEDAPGDRRGQQRVAGGDGVDRRDELFG